MSQEEEKFPMNIDLNNRNKGALSNNNLGIKMKKRKNWVNLKFIILLIMIFSLIILCNNLISFNKKYSHKINFQPYGISDVLKLINNHSESTNEQIEKFILNCRSDTLIDPNIKNYNLSEKPKLSIITISYNQGLLIAGAIRSIQSLSLKDIEIIVVDDNSKDESINIIKKLQIEDKRIILVENKENVGPYRSRENGLKQANGEYIYFLDGDDLLLEYGLVDSYNFGKINNLDIIEHDYYVGWENKLYNKVQHDHKGGIIFKGKEVQYAHNRDHNNNIIFNCYSLCRFLIKKEIVDKAYKFANDNAYHNFNNVFYWEDQAIGLVSASFAKSIYYINASGFFYNRNSNSSTANYNEEKIKKLIFDLKYILKIILLIYDNSDEGCSLKNSIINTYLSWLGNDFFKNLIEGNNDLINVFNDVLQMKNLSDSNKNRINILISILIENKKSK